MSASSLLKGKLFCSIYKSRKRPDMYLYVPRGKGLKELPQALAEPVSYTHLTLPTILRV